MFNSIKTKVKTLASTSLSINLNFLDIVFGRARDGGVSPHIIWTSGGYLSRYSHRGHTGGLSALK